MSMRIQNILRLYHDIIDPLGVYKYPDFLNHIYCSGLFLSRWFITELCKSGLWLDSNSAVRHFSSTENFVCEVNFDLFRFPFSYMALGAIVVSQRIEPSHLIWGTDVAFTESVPHPALHLQINRASWLEIANR